MTEPTFAADPDELAAAANDWRAHAGRFGGGDVPMSGGELDIHREMAQLTAAINSITEGLRDRLTGTADAAEQFGKSAGAQDESASKIMQGIGGLAGPPMQAAASMGQAAASAATGTAGALAGALKPQSQQPTEIHHEEEQSHDK
jgi:hypothetical protein